MKKRVISLLLLGILLVSPLVLAQEQAQTYSGFDRFIDNVKMFFSFGDKKVMLALNIREKEIDSAVVNTKNGDDEKAEKNLERARERLQFVQNKVSKDIAEDVKTNIDETINRINEEENLPDNFKTYILEEEKTQLTAELVIEVEGKEGQTLTREIVKDGESGKNKVEIIVDGDDGQTKVMEIEGKIAEIDNQIVEGTGESKTGSEISDDGLTPEIETDVAGGNGGDNNVVDGDSGGMASGTNGGASGGTAGGSGDSGVVDEGTNVIDEGTVDVDSSDNVVEKGETQVEEGINVVETGIDTDTDRVDPNATPKTPLPTDGSICCKKTKNGETRYHWDNEEDCLNPANIKGEVVENDVCVALGTEVLDEEDPESWGSVEGGVPEECVAQGVYDDEACGEIMKKAEVCCKKMINGEQKYEWEPGDVCIIGYGERVDDDFC